MKPILFNTEMVQAILDGRKTQTRRVIKPKYRDDEYGYQILTNKATGEQWIEKHDEHEMSFDSPRYIKPKYNVGDILYVRETWSKVTKGFGFNAYEEYVYKASNTDICDIKWKPLIHMPKEAARTFLKVTDVRVERLQEISAKDCIKESVQCDALEVGEEFVRGIYHGIWDSTVKKSDINKYGWDANPWVWVYEFERIKKP